MSTLTATALAVTPSGMSFIRERAVKRLIREFVAAGKPTLDPSGGNQVIIGALLQEIEHSNGKSARLYTNMEPPEMFSMAFHLNSLGHTVLVERNARPGHTDPHIIIVV